MSATDAIARDLEDIRAALGGRQAPFLASLLARVRVVATESVPTAGVDDKTWMYVNPKKWGEWNFLEKAYIASHELCHAVKLDPIREKAKVKDPRKNPGNHRIFNCAADSTVFRILKELIRCPTIEKDCITPEWVSAQTMTPVTEIERMTVEEIYDLLKKHMKSVKVDIVFDIIPGHGPKGSVVQEGAPVFVKGAPDEIKEAWKDFISRARETQRATGTVPAGVERFVNELIKPKLDPRSLIRCAIRVGIGKAIVSDWKQKSRRYPNLPGIKRLTVPTILSLVDASGSISEEDLKLELGTIYEFSRHANVIAVSFDAEAYNVVSGKKPSDVIAKMAKEMRGGGGTEIRKALETALKQMKYKDVVLILTDGAIFDLETEPVQRLLAQIAHKASVCAFLTIDREVYAPQWRTIKLTSR